ncbi:hypothetical protein TNCV_4066601 [Trichonephila clavipes]|uniref:Uncharacterized protein n=1 Tax=Trichonephila clavipes TaxID=2585209 RepID=A0A8X6W8U4_TRICX|nr:hypothetical protein TNCV_4066601 [Trichonephila clavipes]
MQGPRPEGPVCFTARKNSLVSNSTQRGRSNAYCPCRRIILYVEDLPGVESCCHLRQPTHKNNCFLKPHKLIPMVQSTAVSELCKALN